MDPMAEDLFSQFTGADSEGELIAALLAISSAIELHAITASKADLITAAREKVRRRLRRILVHDMEHTHDRVDYFELLPAPTVSQSSISSSPTRPSRPTHSPTHPTLHTTQKATMASEQWTKTVATMLGKTLRSFGDASAVVAAPPAPLILRYQMNRGVDAVPSGGCRVRRGMSLSSDQVASVHWDDFPDDIVLVSEVHGDWLKLAPVMDSPQLKGSYSYAEFDIETEGFCCMNVPGADPLFTLLADDE